MTAAAPEPTVRGLGARDLVLRTDTGDTVGLPVERWLGRLTSADETVVRAARGPVLDVGCGPGRFVRALAERGTVVLGIDVAPHALATARARGCHVLERSVFDDIPGAGRYRTVLFVDGSIGIGGDPVRLLGRAGSLLDAGGGMVLEVETPGIGLWTGRARLESPRSGAGPWFPWARADVTGLDEVLRGSWEAGERFDVAGSWQDAGRCFVHLVHRPPSIPV